MSREVYLAFERFKNAHYKAIQTDTLLGECDWNADRAWKLEKKAKQFWEDARKSEREFKEMLFTEDGELL